jgi:hypothetical protein
MCDAAKDERTPDCDTGPAPPFPCSRPQPFLSFCNPEPSLFFVIGLFVQESSLKDAYLLLSVTTP